MNRVNSILKNETYRGYLDRLSVYEKDRRFCRHDIAHFLSVARIMEIKKLALNFDISRDVIYAASLLHDIGRVPQYEEGADHSAAGAKIAAAILRECRYTDSEIEMISTAISDHNSADDRNDLSRLLRDADRLSRNCFVCPAYDACNWPESRRNNEVTI